MVCTTSRDASGASAVASIRLSGTRYSSNCGSALQEDRTVRLIEVDAVELFHGAPGVHPRRIPGRGAGVGGCARTPAGSAVLAPPARGRGQLV
ncbi:hypothetical protein ACFVS9_06215 [Streptomyces sp. NPDC058008]|uniref:hypothetical protein n=1 Tax=Streptomyces sp. NPDC058008 TaxID=3346303 RepID=UPI0036F09BFA